METVYRIEKVSPITDSQGGNGNSDLFARKDNKSGNGESFRPLLNEASDTLLNSRSATEVFDEIMKI